MISFTIPLETPAKKNSRITLRNGRTIPSKRYMEWHEQAKEYVDMPLMLNQPLEIEFHFIHGDLRRRDSDNGVSSILDLLKDCAVIEDDNWNIIRKIHVNNSYRKGEAECQIIIRII